MAASTEQINFTITAVDKTMAAFASVNNSLQKMNAFVGKAKFALGAIATSFVAQEIIQGLTEAADRANKFTDSAEKIGTSVEFLSEMSFAAKMAGSDFETLEGALLKFSKGIDEASSSVKSGIAYDFKRLGVDIKDTTGQLKPTSQLFLEVADKIASFENGARKASVATALFGKQGAELLPMLNLGSEGIKKLQQQADDLGVTFTTKGAEPIKKFKDQMTIFGFAMDGIYNRLMERLAPSLVTFAQYIGTAHNNTKETTRAFSGLKEVADTLSPIFRFLAAGAFFIGSAFIESAKDILAFIRAAGAAAEMKLPEASKILEDRFAAQKTLTETWQQAVEVFEGSMKGTKELNVAVNKNTKNMGDNAQAVSGQTEKLKEFLIKQREAIDLLALEGEKVRMTSSEYEIFKAQKEGMNEINKLVRENSGANTVAFRQEAEALLAEKIAMMQRNEEFKKSFEGGMVDGLKRVREQFTNVGQAVSDTWVNAFQSMEDAFVNFVKTGKLDFKSLADSIIADMARITFRQMISGLFGGGSGGGFNLFSIFGLGGSSSSVPLPPIVQRASGGSVSSGSPYLVGENGPELFMPNRTGSIAADPSMVGTNGGSVNVYQTINVSTGVQQTVRAEIQSLLPQISNAAKAAVIDAKRRGGSFANAFGG